MQIEHGTDEICNRSGTVAYSNKGRIMHLTRNGLTEKVARRSSNVKWRWFVGPIENALAEAGEEWQHLALASGAPPTALPMWCASMYKAFGEIGGPLSIHRLYCGSRLVAVLPLTFRRGLCRTWRPYQHLWYTPLWAFALDNQGESVGPEIRRHLLAHAEQVNLKYMLAGSECTACLLDGVDPDCLLVEKEPDTADVYCPLDVSWEDCLAHMSPHLVRTTRKSIRHLEGKGELRIQVVTSASGLHEAMTECLELEKAGWKGRKGTAIACLPPVEQFYRDLASRAAEGGVLLLTMLRFDGRLIGFDLSLRTQHRIDSLKSAYDEEMARQSPGNVVTYMTLERDCSRGWTRGFHLGHPTPSKLKWTNRRNELVRIVLFANTWRGGCSRTGQRGLRLFVRGVRHGLRMVMGDRI